MSVTGISSGAASFSSQSSQSGLNSSRVKTFARHETAASKAAAAPKAAASSTQVTSAPVSSDQAQSAQLTALQLAEESDADLQQLAAQGNVQAQQELDRRAGANSSGSTPGTGLLINVVA